MFGVYAHTRILYKDDDTTRWLLLCSADSADFADFEEARILGDDRTNLFVAKLQGVANRTLLNLRNLRNLWLNPFSVFGFKVQTETVRLDRTALVSWASLIITPMG